MSSDNKAKKVSNYELFYDLVFVLTISMMTGMIHHAHITFFVMVQFFFACMMMSRLWISETLYLNKYGERDPMDIITICINMFLIGFLSKLLTLDWAGVYLHFNLLFILANFSIILQYMFRARKNNSFTKDMKQHVRLIAIEILLSLACIGLIHAHLMEKVLPIIALLYGIWIFLSLRSILNRQGKGEETNFPHLLERCQLITIICFGETVLAVLKNFEIEQDLLISILLFAFVGSLFFAYITQTALFINHHHGNNPSLLLVSHIFILAGIMSMTVGIEFLKDSTHFTDGIFLLSLGMLLYYSCLLLNSIYKKEHIHLSIRLLSLHVGGFLLGIFLLLFFGKNLLLASLILVSTGIGQALIFRYRGERDYKPHIHS